MAKGSGSALRCPLLAVSSPELPWVPEAGETEAGKCQRLGTGWAAVMTDLDER